MHFEIIVAAAIVLGFLIVAAALWTRGAMRPWLIQGGRKARIEVVSDLDALETHRIAFQFEGKTHVIPPIDVVSFAETMNALAEIDLLKSKKSLSEKELVDAYEYLFSTVCPTINRKAIERMSHQQIAALFNLILEVIMGKAQVDAQKKSTKAGKELKAARSGNP